MSVDNPGSSIIIVRPASAPLKPVAPLFRKPGPRESTAIRLPTGNCATIWVMTVYAFAAPRRRTFRKRQTGRLVAQEAFVTQPLGSWTRPRSSDNTDRVPRLFDGARRFGLRHSFNLGQSYCRCNQRRADSLVGLLRAPTAMSLMLSGNIYDALNAARKQLGLFPEFDK